MGVSWRLALFGLWMVVFIPRSTIAAPILGVSPGTPCGALAPTSTNCSLFTIDPLAAPLLNGQFEFDNDVALFQFVLGPGTYTFSAGSTSAATAFDPILALFQQDGSAFTYTTPEGEFRALGFDPAPDVDASLPLLTLTGGATYFLALTQFGPFAGNFPIGSLLEGFDQDAFPCFTFQFEPCSSGDPNLFGTQSGNFSLNVTLTRTDTASVPEPGTLLLLALGSIGAGVFRHRLTRRHAGRS